MEQLDAYCVHVVCLSCNVVVQCICMNIDMDLCLLTTTAEMLYLPGQLELFVLQVHGLLAMLAGHTL